MSSRNGSDLMPAVFEYKLIYIFRINDEAHKGLLKIGDATIRSRFAPEKITQEELEEAARKRIAQYTKTAMTDAEVLHTEIAIRPSKKSGKPESFRDYAVHSVLKRTNSKYKYIDCGGAKEWFRVDLQTARNAIKAAKENRSSLNPDETADVWDPIVLRREQLDAVTQTERHFRNKKNNRFLWNAKMRFGKTVSALEFIRRSKLEIKHTIIITHRPAVNAGWYEDFHKVFSHDNPEYQFGTRDNVQVGTKWSELRRSDRPFIYFASIQDLRGSEEAGGKFNKNDDVFDYPWDLVIVDEAHEGTQTILGDAVIKKLLKEGSGHRTLLLALSGTPFNIAEKYEDQCFTWDYVQEQQRKKEYAEMGLSNPYEDLPEMRMMTFNLADEIKGYQQFQDKAFNFSEFFRVDENGFIHKDDVKRFLDLLCQPGRTGYPFTSDEYRQMFRHTFWVVPGVKEARELQKLLEAHEVFGQFAVCNVAGEGNIENDDALQTVLDCIAKNDYTITLTCGKLTTGVTVPEWTAVLYLAGTTSTSAQSYMQTIFRVQSPCNSFGMTKRYCYVFDFAPDRSLKLVSDAIALGARKPGKTTKVDRTVIGAFLNFCPIISVDATQMKPFNVDGLIRQLKRAFAERAVRSGFEDNSIYNSNLLHLDDLDKELFKQLKGIVGSAGSKSGKDEFIIANEGLDNEEHEVFSEPRSDDSLSDAPEPQNEEQQKLEKAKEERRKAIQILRAVSIRIPLLIYGAVVGNGNGDIDFCSDVTLEWLLENIDEVSWNEFMPKGVTKELFQKFTKYYDEDIFIEAGRQIRQKVKDADELPPLLRVQKIIEILSCFKNPDKETVLTPWRVVNMHLGDCLGGYDWFDEKHEAFRLDDDGNPSPRWVDQGQVTADTWDNPHARILEINSKTGVYPLFATFCIWARRCYDEYIATLPIAPAETWKWKRDIPLADILKLVGEGRQRTVWNEVVAENIFVVCMTPMAKAITKRTLLGFSDSDYNAEYIENLVAKMKESCNTLAQLLRNEYFWHRGNGIMDFDAIVGNPPYIEKDGGSKASATPIYQYFISNAITLNARYCSMIVPARWFSGGKGLDEFRDNALHDKRFAKLFDYFDALECFSSADISGGVCYFLWNKNGKDECEIESHILSTVSTMKRPLLEPGMDSFIRFNEAVSIIHKVNAISENSFADDISSRKPFGLSTTAKISKKKSSPTMIKVYAYPEDGYIERADIKQNTSWIDKCKVCISYAYGERGSFPYLVIGKPFIADQGSCCTETYLVVSVCDAKTVAENIVSYMRTKFFRFLVLLKKNTQHATKTVYSFVPTQDFSTPWTDEQLYAKYGLEPNEIQFIDAMVRPMNID